MIIEWCVQQPSDFVPSKTGFIVSLHRLISVTLLTLVQASSKGIHRTVFEVGRISGHQLVRGRVGFLEVMYETHWTGLLSPS